MKQAEMVSFVCCNLNEVELQDALEVRPVVMLVSLGLRLLVLRHMCPVDDRGSYSCYGLLLASMYFSLVFKPIRSS